MVGGLRIPPLNLKGAVFFFSYFIMIGFVSTNTQKLPKKRHKYSSQEDYNKSQSHPFWSGVKPRSSYVEL